MDKIATNNHFVVLKKEAKHAKAMVIGKLVRRINALKKDKEKLEDDEAKVSKIDGKIAKLHEEIRLLKTIDLYQIAKQATLRPDTNHWDKVISDNKATNEERAMARVICKNNVQKQVNKFRSDYKDCDEWLNEYIEYREKKRELREKTEKKRFKPKLKPIKEKPRAKKEVAQEQEQESENEDEDGDEDEDEDESS